MIKVIKNGYVCHFTDTEGYTRVLYRRTVKEIAQEVKGVLGFVPDYKRELNFKKKAGGNMESFLLLGFIWAGLYVAVLWIAGK